MLRQVARAVKGSWVARQGGRRGWQEILGAPPAQAVAVAHRIPRAADPAVAPPVVRWHLPGARLTANECVDCRSRMHTQLRETQPHPRPSSVLRKLGVSNPADLGFDQQRLAKTGEREAHHDVFSWTSPVLCRVEDAAGSDVLSQAAVPAVFAV